MLRRLALAWVLCCHVARADDGRAFVSVTAAVSTSENPFALPSNPYGPDGDPTFSLWRAGGAASYAFAPDAHLAVRAELAYLSCFLRATSHTS